MKDKIKSEIDEIHETTSVDVEDILLQRFKKMAVETAVKTEQLGIERIKREKLEQSLIPLSEAEEAFQILGSKRFELQLIALKYPLLQPGDVFL